jgi:hypothetical protein
MILYLLLDPPGQGYKINYVHGIASQILLLTVTQTFITPLFRILNIKYFLTKMLKIYFKLPNSKLSLNQDELN